MKIFVKALDLGVANIRPIHQLARDQNSSFEEHFLIFSPIKKRRQVKETEPWDHPYVELPNKLAILKRKEQTPG